MLLEFAYIALDLFITSVLIFIGWRAIDKSCKKEIATQKKVILIVGLLLWHSYIFVISQASFIKTFSFPPRFFLLMILPAFIFTGIFIYRNRKANWIMTISPQTLIYFQSFRVLIEVLFVFSVAKGVLNPQVTIEGYNFDMIFAIATPLIAFLCFQLKLLPLRVMLYWNYLGLVVIASIIFVFMTSIYAPHWYGANHALVPMSFTDEPYVLVPSFLMPAAVFIHFLSIVQLQRVLKKKTISITG